MASLEVDPMMAAGIALYHFIRHEKPFSNSDWKAPGTQIAPQYEDSFHASVIGYQFFVYLKLIEQKFGPEIARIVREYQIIAMNRLPDKVGDQLAELLQMIQSAHEAAVKSPLTNRPDSEVPIEWLMALHLLCTEMKDSPYYVPREKLKAGIEPKMPDDGLDMVLAECLAYGADAATEVFAPMVQKFEFKPETVSGLIRESSSTKAENTKTDELVWSDDPGCFERHLQRRYLNPLFPPASRIVTQDEADAARARDASEAEALWKKIIDLAQLFPPGQVTVAELLEQRRRVDELMEEAAAIGSLRAERATAKIYLAIISDMERAVTNDPVASAKLQKVNGEYVKVGLAMKNRFVAQFGRRDTPIKSDEILPSLLTEDLETIRKFMIFVAEHEDLLKLHEQMAPDALELVRQVEATGVIIPERDEKLKALRFQLK